MTLPSGLTRRDVLMKIGIFLNGVVALILAVPVVRYLLSPVARGQKGAYQSWIPLGDLTEFPAGETRLTTYRNPVVSATDGATADIACWVRNVDGETFQVFAINCAHLGCPVRWFPQSNLFMCPCHGGGYSPPGYRPGY
ncbi:MAG: Rieske 2Fe-2S domain-containing protein, partial [Candidatus Acidiferrales bacterium]